MKFIDSIGKNFQTLKFQSQELLQLKKACEGKYFDDYIDMLKRMGGFSNGYKRNVNELIDKFIKMRCQIHNRQGSRLGRFDSQPR